jgi:hypothetical protein
VTVWFGYKSDIADWRYASFPVVCAETAGQAGLQGSLTMLHEFGIRVLLGLGFEVLRDLQGYLAIWLDAGSECRGAKQHYQG